VKVGQVAAGEVKRDALLFNRDVITAYGIQQEMGMGLLHIEDVTHWSIPAYRGSRSADAYSSVMIPSHILTTKEPSYRITRKGKEHSGKTAAQ
jgi:hypothetical protein